MIGLIFTDHQIAICILSAMAIDMMNSGFHWKNMTECFFCNEYMLKNMA